MRVQLNTVVDDASESYNVVVYGLNTWVLNVQVMKPTDVLKERKRCELFHLHKLEAYNFLTVCEINILKCLRIAQVDRVEVK